MYVQGIYNPQFQQAAAAQYYPHHHVYGSSSSGMGSPYGYGYSLPASRGTFSATPQRFHGGPSYLYYPTPQMDAAAVAAAAASFSPTAYPPSPLPPLLHPAPRHPFPASSSGMSPLIIFSVQSKVITRSKTHLFFYIVTFSRDTVLNLTLHLSLSNNL